MEETSKAQCDPEQWHSICTTVCLKPVWDSMQSLLQHTSQLLHYWKPPYFPVHGNGYHIWDCTQNKWAGIDHTGKTLLTPAININFVLTRSSERSVKGDNLSRAKQCNKTKPKIWHLETEPHFFLSNTSSHWQLELRSKSPDLDQKHS